MNPQIDKERFERDGFLRIDALVPTDEAEHLLGLYDRFLDGRIATGTLRSDLGAGSQRKNRAAENITQIMWPSELVPVLHDTPAYRRALRIARDLLGEDIAFDFDMLIDKAPHTATPTPWHQDAAYWPDLPDKRASSCWIALEEATIDNGCMWFVPGTHKHPLRPHQPAGPGGALECDGAEEEAVPVPLPPGACTLHHGGTLHYSRGNTTEGHRRALILNFRPAEMIRLERQLGFDHGKSSNVRQVRNPAARTNGTGPAA